MTKTYELWIPFQGFYESIHDHGFDMELERIVDYLIEQGDLDSETGSTDDIDYDCDFKHAAESYVSAFNNAIAFTFTFDSPCDKIEFTFVELDSPRFYNYRTDRILCNVSYEHLSLIFRHTDKEKLREFVKERHSHRSGFVSFYSDDLDEWIKTPISEWDHNQLETVFLAFLASQEVDPNELEMQAFEDMASNGAYDVEWELKEKTE